MPQLAPHLHQRGREVQRYGTVIRMPLGLDQEACEASVRSLNQLLADTITMRDLYKQHHWQVGGPTFYALHLLFDKHYEEQAKLVDEIAERVQLLGGVSLAMAADVAAESSLEKPPRGRESVPVQLSRLLDAHEQLLIEARKAASEASDHHDDGTNDLLVSQVIRTNEFHVWFLSQHLVDIPLVDETESLQQPEVAMR